MKNPLRVLLICLALGLIVGAVYWAVYGNEKREGERRQVDRIIETLNLSPGQVVADLGAGDGIFTRPLARKVGHAGVVYAIEIKQRLLKKIEEKAREQGLQNIRPVLAAEDDPKLPEPVDLILIVDTLHHISNRETYLKNLRRYLKPSGRVAIIDFSDSWPWFHGKMKYSLAELEVWMKAAGFAQVEKHDFVKKTSFIDQITVCYQAFFNTKGQRVKGSKKTKQIKPVTLL